MEICANENIKKINNSKFVNAGLYISIFLLIFAVSRSNIYYYDLTPFGIAIVFALFAIKFNGVILAGLYMSAYSLASMTIAGVIESANVAIVLIILEVIVSRKKLNLKKWQLIISVIIANISYVLLNIDTGRLTLALLISIVLEFIFLYSCLIFLNATINRGFVIKLNTDEKIAGYVIVIIAMMGLSRTNIYIINVGLIIGELAVLLGVNIASAGRNIILSAIIGMSFSIAWYNPIFISMFVVIGILAIAFKCNYKILSVLATIIGYIIFNLFFQSGISTGELISICIGGVIFLIVPRKLYDGILNKFNVKTQVTYSNILEKSKKQIVRRVTELSNIFGQMNIVYRDMVKGNLTQEKVVEVLRDALIDNTCKDCTNYNKCYRSSNSFALSAIDTLISTGYEKGKVLLVDIPQYITSTCVCVNKLVSNLNDLISSYKDYSGIVSNLDTSRILIADQLYGVKQLLLSLSKEVDININFDGKLEERIIEELSYKNVICLDCVIYQQDIQNISIELIVKTNSINDNSIIKVVNKLLNLKMRIVSKDSSSMPGVSVIGMNTCPNYDIVFGSSGGNKTGKLKCGDSHLISKIDDGKYMVSICDGMGSGSKAHSISELSINLIEKFYQAGFDNDIILSSVNKLLNLNEDENFSTIDLCIIDGRKNIYDFIKLGAANGYIKRDNGTLEVIESSNLPVGMLEEISPHITKKLISPMDMLVFVSDGVADSFDEYIGLDEYIRSLDIINPQTLADEILKKALDIRNGVYIDDMTVICVRVQECV